MALDPAPGECVHAPGIATETTAPELKSGVWVLNEIDVEKGELLHLVTIVEWLKSSGRFEPDKEMRGITGDFTYYVAMTTEGTSVHIRVDRNNRRCDVIVTPSDQMLELSITTALSALLGVEFTQLKHRRARGMRIFEAE